MNCFKMVKLFIMAGCATLVAGLSGCVMVVTNPDPYQEHYQTAEVDYVHVRPGSVTKRPSRTIKKPAQKPIAQSRDHPIEQTTKTDFNQVIEGWICKIQNREWFN